MFGAISELATVMEFDFNSIRLHALSSPAEGTIRYDTTDY